MWTPAFGGNGGEPFEVFNDDFSVLGVKGRFGDWIDQLSFDFNNVKSGEYETSEEIGGNGGEEFFWNLPVAAEPEIIRVWAVPDQFVHGLQFHLSNGEDSPLFGKPTGDLYEINVAGKRVAGFGGRKGAYLDQVRFYLCAKDL